jgi:hypothetical protein
MDSSSDDANNDDVHVIPSSYDNNADDQNHVRCTMIETARHHPTSRSRKHYISLVNLMNMNDRRFHMFILDYQQTGDDDDEKIELDDETNTDVSTLETLCKTMQHQLEVLDHLQDTYVIVQYWLYLKFLYYITMHERIGTSTYEEKRRAVISAIVNHLQQQSTSKRSQAQVLNLKETIYRRLDLISVLLSDRDLIRRFSQRPHLFNLITKSNNVSDFRSSNDAIYRQNISALLSLLDSHSYLNSRSPHIYSLCSMISRDLIFDDDNVFGTGIIARCPLKVSLEIDPSSTPKNLICQVRGKHIKIDDLDRQYLSHVMKLKSRWYDLSWIWCGFINHTTPKLANVGIFTDGKLYLMKNINADDELRIDYGIEYWIYRLTSVLLHQWNDSHQQTWKKLHEVTSDYSSLLEDKFYTWTGEENQVDHERIIGKIDEYIREFKPIHDRQVAALPKGSTSPALPFRLSSSSAHTKPAVNRSRSEPELSDPTIDTTIAKKKRKRRKKVTSESEDETEGDESDDDDDDDDDDEVEEKEEGNEDDETAQNHFFQRVGVFNVNVTNINSVYFKQRFAVYFAMFKRCRKRFPYTVREEVNTDIDSFTKLSVNELYRMI